MKDSMFKVSARLFLVLGFIFAFTACKKDAGEGGTSTIEGKLYKLKTYQNSTTGEMDTLYYQLNSGKDVYIIYSDDENKVYDDNFETDWAGKYHFKYLRKGDYTIYTYADSTDANNVVYDYPVFRHVSITENNSSIVVDDFVILK